MINNPARPQTQDGRTPTMPNALIISMLSSPASAGLARTLTEHRLRKWNYSHILDDALLIVAELVANAIQETPGKKLRFQISRDPKGVLIAVWDSSPRPPRPRPVPQLTLENLDLSEDSFDTNGGWGLHIVQTLATACGCTRDAGGGKWTWARLTP